MNNKVPEILIVDDAKTMRTVVVAILKAQKYLLDQAEDGCQAFEMIKHKQYDLIITDIHMPNMSGLELCTKVRQELKFKNLPILVMTTDRDYDAVEKVFKAGASDFIGKPINELELVSRTNRLLEQRAIEKALYIAQKSAELTNTRKTQFLASVNHELKNPLNGIYGYAQILHDLEKEPKKKAMLTVLVKGAEQMTSMVNQLLELDKIESGYVKMASEPITLLELVEKCVNQNLPMIESRALTVSVDLTSALVVNSDYKMLFSIVTNLLSNATKYNKPGGNITIKAHNEADMIRIDISDSGIGMSEHELAKIFDPFTRFAEQNTAIEGHGLGMAITKSSADALGISMDIVSRLGEGTSVSLTMAKQLN